MKLGRWMPIDKNFAYSLPCDRKFTDLEAIVSLTLDYDNGVPVTILGYARLWRWSRTRVASFLCEIGVELVKLDPHVRKTRSRIVIKHKDDKQKTLSKHGRMINSKWLSGSSDNKKAIKKQKDGTTKDPNPENPNKPPTKLSSGGEKNIVGESQKQAQVEYLRLLKKYGDMRSFFALASDKRRQWKKMGGKLSDRDLEQLNGWQQNQHNEAVKLKKIEAIQVVDLCQEEMARAQYGRNLEALPSSISTIIAKLDSDSGKG